jgi:hypothetical protein
MALDRHFMESEVHLLDSDGKFELSTSTLISPLNAPALSTHLDALALSITFKANFKP